MYCRQLLGAPRRRPGHPSPDGTRFVFTQSTYSFAAHSKTSEIVLYTFANQELVVISRDTSVSEPRWLDDSHLVWLKQGEQGNTSFVVADADAPAKTYTAGTVPGPVSNIKLYIIEAGTVAIAVAGKANPDGSLHNPKDTPKSFTSGKLYDATFVRHWDTYIAKERNSIFTALLRKAPSRVHGREGRYNLAGFVNALRGTGLESPIPPFGGTDHFDIGRDGLVFVAKDPELNPATHTKCNAYWIYKEDLIEFAEPNPSKIQTPGFEGAATSPVISPNGAIAFLQMLTDGYESDQNHVICVRLGSPPSSSTARAATLETCVMSPEQYSPDVPWESLSPGALTWSSDGKSIYAQAELRGAGCLFALGVPMFSQTPIQVRQLTSRNYILEAIPIPKSPCLLLSSNSLVDNIIYSILDPSNPDSPASPAAPSINLTHLSLSATTTALSTGTTTPVSFSSSSSSNTTVLSIPSILHNSFGLSSSQVSSFWYHGANSRSVHALMIVPSSFDRTKKYPLAYLIHGGPQGAWNDQWSTRWNAALFAETGYVVVMPNPTGSTGYGQPFTDAIAGNWGGDPYTDLVKGIEYIESSLPFIDTDRMLALGASYGGYMINWIAGHPLAHKFKALVCHDGVFTLAGQLASEEQYFPMHDFGGPYYSNPDNYARWDPAAHADKWSTPMLIIHSDLDYRLTVSEGLSMFNVCQGKGIKSRFLTFSDEGHWVLREENSLVWWLVVLNWCNSFVGLPVVKDGAGRTGEEVLMQGPRGLPSDR